MPRSMKYIMVLTPSGEAPFIFPDFIGHRQFVIDQQINPRHVISAGFVQLVNGKIDAHGRSHELNLAAKEGDSALISRAMEL